MPAQPPLISLSGRSTSQTQGSLGYISLPVSMSVHILGTWNKWSHNICLITSNSFTYVFKIHSRGRMPRISFLVKTVWPGMSCLSIHPWVSTHTVPPVWLNVNNIALHVGREISFWISAFILFRRYLEEELVGHTIVLYSVLSTPPPSPFKKHFLKLILFSLF